eukprot:5310960-Pyramimonas_sp.AAC.1
MGQALGASGPGQRQGLARRRAGRAEADRAVAQARRLRREHRRVSGRARTRAGSATRRVGARERVHARAEFAKIHVCLLLSCTGVRFRARFGRYRPPKASPLSLSFVQINMGHFYFLFRCAVSCDLTWPRFRLVFGLPYCAVVNIIMFSSISPQRPCTLSPTMGGGFSFA